MTNTDALALVPGDPIRLRPQPTWATTPPTRTIYTVARVDFQAGYPEVRILSVEGLRFALSEGKRHSGFPVEPA